MNDSQIETLEQVRQFLDGVAIMKITIPSKTECYRWIQGTLVRFRYLALGKADRGLIRRYLQQISGYSKGYCQLKRNSPYFQLLRTLPVTNNQVLTAQLAGRSLYSSA